MQEQIWGGEFLVWFFRYQILKVSGNRKLKFIQLCSPLSLPLEVLKRQIKTTWWRSAWCDGPLDTSTFCFWTWVTLHPRFWTLRNFQSHGVEIPLVIHPHSSHGDIGRSISVVGADKSPKQWEGAEGSLSQSWWEQEDEDTRPHWHRHWSLISGLWSLVTGAPGQPRDNTGANRGLGRSHRRVVSHSRGFTRPASVRWWQGLSGINLEL